MPFTPYHFGPSAFIGLIFRKWIDVPVFILANAIVDIEVLVVMIFGLGAPHHRYAHTLQVGAAVGLLWGIAAYPFRRLFKIIMLTLCVPYKTNFFKMVLSGILSVWLHVLIDGAYHYDVQVFWPNETKSLWVTVMSRIDQDSDKEHMCYLSCYGYCSLRNRNLFIYERTKTRGKTMIKYEHGW